MVFELMGWLGAVLYIISYFLLARGIWKQNQAKYHALNLSGAACLIIHAIYLHDMANILVNTVWAGIALVSIYNFSTTLLRSKA